MTPLSLFGTDLADTALLERAAHVGREHAVDTGVAPRASTATQKDLGQYPTPVWFAEELLSIVAPDLDASCRVLDCAAGSGHLLAPIPRAIEAFGVEIDPAIAAKGEAYTGRPYIVGDFRTASIPLTMVPTHIVSNPPYSLRLFEEFLGRARTLLPEHGRAGFLIPAAFFQTSASTLRFTDKWRVEQRLVPRDIFPGLSMPICVAVFSKSAERVLVGFAFYKKVAEVRELPEATRKLLNDPPSGNSWRDVVEAALASLGGQGSTSQIVQAAMGRIPDEKRQNSFPAQKIRQTLQRHFRHVTHGVWAQPGAQAA